MRARDINLAYGPDGERLQRAVLAGSSSVEVASTGTSSATRIAGEFIDFALDADGTTITALSARAAGPTSPAELELPAQADAPPRAIRAASIQGPTPGAASAPGRGLTTMRFTDNVEYRETPPPPAAPRVATARMLDLVLQPGLGALDEARFSGNATLKEGSSLEATARNARYNVKAGTFEFTGPDDQQRLPRVKDQDQATIQGTRILVTPDSRKVSAAGTVQTTIQPAQKRPDGTVVRTPGILAQDQPALATSDELEYDGAASRAVFTSKVQSRLWQAQGNSIYAVAIVVDDAKGDLNARGSVVSTIKLEQTDAKTGRKETVASTVRADTMAYEDAVHRATYTGHVQMKGGPQGDMTADKAVLFLTDNGGALDRLEAYENVEVVDPGTEKTGRRTTSGDRLTYLAADESYKVTGKLVKINEQCFGETLCHTLTFYRSVDRMIVDGNMKRRTQTKGGQGCKQEPRFD
jgi:lipopolysaccharide export system protein LptA